MTFMRSLIGTTVLFLVLGMTGFAQESPQDQYLKIYLLIQEADKLETAGQKASARERYQVSYDQLRKLQQANPQWEPTIVKFRLKYTLDKVEQLQGATDQNPGQVIAPIPDELMTEVPETPTAPEPVPAPAPTVPSTFPATGTTGMTGETMEPTEPVTPTLTPTQQIEQRAPSPMGTTQEPSIGFTGGPGDPIVPPMDPLDGAPEELKQRIRTLESQLADARAQLADAKTEAAQLRTRVQDLEKKIQIAMEGSTEDKISMMMEENQRLKDQLSSTEAMITGLQTGDSAQSIINLKKQVEKIQGQLELAKQENTALRETNDEYRQQLDTLQAELDLAKNDDQVNTLKEENAVLRDIVNRQLKEQARRDIAKRLAMEELENLAIDSAKLETQLDILGSPLVELSDDERALLRRPTTGLVVEETGEISTSLEGDSTSIDNYATRPRVPGEFKDVAEEANTLFQQGKFDEAAAKYQTILNSYPESLYAISNLAVVRFQQGRYPGAEEYLRRAVKLAPRDAFSHSILGIVLYQQGKYDEAVQILSRASALDPNDPKTRNYLGIAASQKGWQEAAEQECRKAIELDPQYGDAHFNLAVIYATQNPPAKELSRRHYNRALELGVPRDDQLESLLN